MDRSLSRSESSVFVQGAVGRAGDPLLVEARECLRQQAAAVAKMSMRLNGSFALAVRLLLSARGHVVVTGLGKSGLVGRKIAATLASTGTPSFFVHSAEAMHGDLGMITDGDVVLLISYSGETAEVSQVVEHLRRRGVPTLALVGSLDSTLAQSVDVSLDVSVDREVCPNNLAPTSSTLATLAMGDTLAVSLMRLRGFREGDFARLHPGGAVGRKLAQVGEALIRADVPVLEPGTTVGDALVMLAGSTLPLALVCDGRTLLGTFSPADVQLTDPASMSRPVSAAMNPKPAVVEPSALISETERRMEREGRRALVCVASSGEVLGVFTRASSERPSQP